MFYGVHYQDIIPFDNAADVYTAGFYQSLDKAIIRLNEVIPNYKKHVNRTVIRNNRVAWINTYEFNDDLNEKPFCCFSLHNQVDLY